MQRRFQQADAKLVTDPLDFKVHLGLTVSQIRGNAHSLRVTVFEYLGPVHGTFLLDVHHLCVQMDSTPRYNAATD